MPSEGWRMPRETDNYVQPKMNTTCRSIHNDVKNDGPLDTHTKDYGEDEGIMLCLVFKELN
jgi:hypothetical protein